jgi:hypothetical protein
MQRRAAAVYFVLFLVLGAGAYGFMQVGMSEPDVELDGPTYTEGESLTVNGTEFTVTTVEGEPGDYSGEVTYFDESAMSTASLENGSTTQFDGGTYTVHIANETDVSEFTLIESLNATAIVADDPEASTIVTDDSGTEYVRFQNGSTAQLSEYLPPAETATIAVGDEFEYVEENVTTTVDAVTTSQVTLTWATPGDVPIDFGEGENATLAGETYFAHFPSSGGVQILPADEYYSTYTSELSDIDYYSERQNGVWGIVIVSLLAAIVLLSAAYLPNK